MEDLYDNLENYEDHKVVEELRKENKELKSKLEEYSKAIDKLQKDFDKVTSDFKKLEMNYSSLLKTAKLEMERKMKIINDFNEKKDTIVLKVLQNKNIQNIRRMRQNIKPVEKGPNNENNNTKIPTDSPTESITARKDLGRMEECRFSSVDTDASSKPDIGARLLKLTDTKVGSPEVSSERTSSTKENTNKKDIRTSRENKALSIRNRRKSMPSQWSQAKFSSDEEDNDDYRNETNQKIYSTRDNKDIRQIADKGYKDRYWTETRDDKNKALDFNVDDKFSGYERDAYYRNRTEKYGYDKYKSRDRYDNVQRHRRYLSPERMCRISRPEEYFHRQEHNGHRVLESPPFDKYGRYNQRNRETRQKNERESYNYSWRDHRQDKYSSKHKWTGDHYDEPVSKKQRVDSSHKYTEEERRTIDQAPIEKAVADLMDEMPQYTSCQSPDFNMGENLVSSEPIREIMSTASVPLEDPRASSKKYKFIKMNNNVLLSTVSGRDVDLRKIDSTTWGLKPMELPKPLTRRPSECSEEIVKNIYMDIENPFSNMSVESGEISHIEEDSGKNIKVGDQDCTSSGVHGKTFVESNTEILISNKDLPKKNYSKSSYRIPKISDKYGDKLCENRNANMQKEVIRPDFLLDTTKVSEIGDAIACHETANIIDNIKCENSLHVEKLQTEAVAAAKQIIEGDLELSDETSDNIYIATKDVTEGTDIGNMLPCNNSPRELSIDLIKSADQDDHVTSETNGAKTKSDKKQPENKKQKAKKKNDKSQDTEKNIKVEPISEKKSKPKKDIKEIKTKFTELFGESNSLITPEDLGIMNLKSLPQESPKYVPICENAQDGVDLKVSDVVKAKISLPSLIPSSDTTNQPTDNKTDTVEMKKINNNNKIVTDSKKKTKESDNPNLLAVNSKKTMSDPKIQKSGIPKLTVDVPVSGSLSAISPIEAPSKTLAKSESIRNPEGLLDQLKNVKSVPCKAEGVMKALATSTPHKGLQQVTLVGQVAPTTVQAHISVSQNADSIATDQSSTSEAMETQNSDDVPDVRIFVKRRRRIVKKPQ